MSLSYELGIKSHINPTFQNNMAVCVCVCVCVCGGGGGWGMFEKVFSGQLGKVLSKALSFRLSFATILAKKLFCIVTCMRQNTASENARVQISSIK